MSRPNWLVEIFFMSQTLIINANKVILVESIIIIGLYNIIVMRKMKDL